MASKLRFSADSVQVNSPAVRKGEPINSAPVKKNLKSNILGS